MLIIPIAVAGIVAHLTYYNISLWYNCITIYETQEMAQTVKSDPLDGWFDIFPLPFRGAAEEVWES